MNICDSKRACLTLLLVLPSQELGHGRFRMLLQSHFLNISQQMDRLTWNWESLIPSALDVT